ncbi:unnamed protein product [Dovyalis caffra]|uniref:GDSL esterase/lipase n=1 Tax=Dovyalis caffra TaxID=77055 RepID=A0AAV1RDH4_9ROSI|nr:unnamed protein product [Dovyalis caffra]
MRFFSDYSTSLNTFYVRATAGFALYSAAADTIVRKNEKIPAVIVFGDSVADTGNNNNQNPLSTCNYPPLGERFHGRKTNRKVWQWKGLFGLYSKVMQFILSENLQPFTDEFFGVKELLPPYLDQSLQLQDLLTGVTCASGGSGYDPETSKSPSVLSLSDQLDLFKGYITKIRSAVGEERTAAILSKSICIVCTGSDDIVVTYFASEHRSSYDVNSYTDLMVSSASSFVQTPAQYGNLAEPKSSLFKSMINLDAK